MSQEQEEQAAWCEHSGDLIDGGLERVYMLKRQAHHDSVEAGVWTWDLLGLRSHVASRAAAFVSQSNLCRGRIEPNYFGTQTRDPATDLSFATAYVQNSPCPV